MKRTKSYEFFQFGSTLIHGKWWAIGVAALKKHGLRGVCLNPRKHTNSPGIIAIGTHLPANGPMATEAIIHETLHAIFPAMSETRVHTAGKTLANVLRKYGQYDLR